MCFQSIFVQHRLRITINSNWLSTHVWWNPHALRGIAIWNSFNKMRKPNHDFVHPQLTRTLFGLFHCVLFNNLWHPNLQLQSTSNHIDVSFIGPKFHAVGGGGGGSNWTADMKSKFTLPITTNMQVLNNNHASMGKLFKFTIVVDLQDFQCCRVISQWHVSIV